MIILLKREPGPHNHFIGTFTNTQSGDLWEYVFSCKSPTCSRFSCRAEYFRSYSDALRTVASNYKQSTLIVLPHLDGRKGCQAAKVAVQDELKQHFGSNVPVIFTIEPHKRGLRDEEVPGGLHLNALVFHDQRFSGYLKASITERVLSRSPRSVPHFSTIGRGDRRANPAYIIKNYQSHHSYHLKRNSRGKRGSLFFGVSRGFWKVPHIPSRGNARLNAAKFQAERRKAYAKVEHLIGDADSLMRRFHTLSGEALVRKARILANMRAALDGKKLRPAPLPDRVAELRTLLERQANINADFDLESDDLDAFWWGEDLFPD